MHLIPTKFIYSIPTLVKKKKKKGARPLDPFGRPLGTLSAKRA